MAEQAPAVRKLYLVRRVDRDLHGGSAADTPHGDGGVRGVFLTREQAARALDQCEEEARHSGDFWPLYPHDLDELLRWTDFERPVFLDWLEDAGIPAPPGSRWAIRSPGPEEGEGSTDGPKMPEDLWLSWLEGLGKEKLAHLYAGLHRFSFFEVREIDLVEGGYPPELWEEWEREPGRRWREQAAQRLPAWRPPPAPAGEAPPADDSDIPF